MPAMWEILDRSACHGLCCARSEATRGHCAVVSTVVDGLVTVDPSVRTEVLGLVPSADRPADILTTAGVPGASAGTSALSWTPSCKPGPQARPPDKFSLSLICNVAAIACGMSYSSLISTWHRSVLSVAVVRAALQCASQLSAGYVA